MCDGLLCCIDGYCVPSDMNPCVCGPCDGCDGTKCGDSCLSGDLIGTCNAESVCIADRECDYQSCSVDCGNFT